MVYSSQYFLLFYNFFLCFHFAYLAPRFYKVKVKVTQLCPILWDPMNYTVLELFQARILEWVAISFSRRSSQPRDQTQVSRIAGGFFTSWGFIKILHFLLYFFLMQHCDIAMWTCSSLRETGFYSSCCLSAGQS